MYSLPKINFKVENPNLKVIYNDEEKKEDE
jgi:hypothetical protein